MSFHSSTTLQPILNFQFIFLSRRLRLAQPSGVCPVSRNGASSEALKLTNLSNIEILVGIHSGNPSPRPVGALRVQI